MRVRFRPLKTSDFYKIDVQGRHRYILPRLRANPLTLHRLTEDPFSFAMEVDGEPKALCGVNTERELWAVLATDLRREMLPLTRYGKAMMDMYILSGPCWASIDRGAENSVRWALAAGMRKVKAGSGPFDTWIYDRP